MIWQPIKTAPKDGTVILLRGGKIDPLYVDSAPDGMEHLYERPVTGWWQDVHEFVCGDASWRYCLYDSGIYGEYEEPTHWAPIPEFKEEP